MALLNPAATTAGVDARLAVFGEAGGELRAS